MKPLAWAVILSDGQPYARCDFRWEAAAIAAALPAAEGVTATVAPLYRSPTLTDAERVAVMWAVATLETDATADAGQNAEAAAALCGLLERTRATGSE